MFKSYNLNYILDKRKTGSHNENMERPNFFMNRDRTPVSLEKKSPRPQTAEMPMARTSEAIAVSVPRINWGELKRR